MVSLQAPQVGTKQGTRAAQYVRVSTDQQKYSIENQAAAIAAYAARRSVIIVRTYSDLGRSGVKIAGRDALQQLIRDVRRGQADFNCILVYDISRWGRFQDVDESAYYEFICRRAGINIHYCADEFENDGSLASIVLKNIKRVAAADYSRQLSKKVFLGQCRVTTLGHWRGGTALYGLRRMLVDEQGKRKTLLRYMQQKSLKAEHVILVPGPQSEIKIVREIFTSFATRKKTRTEIANDLNARRIRNARGNRWSMLTISNMLKNETYLGHLVYNRRSQKLGGELIRNPREMWVTYDNAFEPIISPKLFAKAQQVQAELAAGRRKTNKELLDKLRALLRRKGRLTTKIMQAAKDVPHERVYAKRFGSLVNAYKKVGFEPHSRYRISETTGKIDKTIRGVADKLIAEFARRRTNVTFVPELYLLTVNRGLTIGMAVARSVANGVGVSSRRWELRKLRYRRADLTLIVRMTPSNTTIQDYFLMPTASLPPREGDRLRISERHFGEFKYDDLHGVLKAIAEWIDTGQNADQTKHKVEGPKRPLRQSR
jgi:DNA invertase Pin-like site-specific DNA recombinase